MGAERDRLKKEYNDLFDERLVRLEKGILNDPMFRDKEREISGKLAQLRAGNRAQTDEGLLCQECGKLFAPDTNRLYAKDYRRCLQHATASELPFERSNYFEVLEDKMSNRPEDVFSHMMRQDKYGE